MAMHRTDDERLARPAVLIVDDDELMRRLLARRLEGHGFDAVCFDDPRLLLASLGDRPPAGIFTDLEMPGLDGIGVTASAREAGYAGFVALVTAETDTSRIGEAVAAGADCVLFKPVGGRELAVAAARIAARRPRDGRLDAVVSALRRVDQGAMLLDGNRGVIFANREARRILGADDPAGFAEAVARCCPSGLVRSSLEAKPAVTYSDILLPKDGTRLLVGLEAHRLASDGSIVHLVLLHDFSRWRRFDDVRTRFATSLSHRMRTPLTSARNAVRLLSDAERPVPVEQRERLLEIGWRNIERLVENLDELQKVFMIESEETEVARTLARLDALVKRHLAGLDEQGAIRGFRMRAPGVTALVGRGRLRDFLSAAAASLAKWAGEAPFVECSASIREDFHDAGGIDRRIKLVLRPRLRSRGSDGPSLGEFLSCDEAHRGLVLARLAAALDGDLDLGAGGAITLLLPLHPAFDREKDLVKPMHMMAERAELAGLPFRLVSLRLVGAIDDAVRFSRLVESSLCREIGDDCAVSRSDEPLGYSVFVAGEPVGGIDGLMRSVRKRFETACRRSGEEIYPTVRWEIRFSREANEHTECPRLDIPALETV
ncbi:MAG: response regulator [Candidatus Krumholzibacteriota bacterium]|nr:response regulator [Candidatus Krumholzibacteriota bacterium]